MGSGHSLHGHDRQQRQRWQTEIIVSGRLVAQNSSLRIFSAMTSVIA
jgi:hypothetical protein